MQNNNNNTNSKLAFILTIIFLFLLVGRLTESFSSEDELAKPDITVSYL
jgi:hypothetical protein